MSPKEFFVDKIAAWFGRDGVTALVYDARTLGASDGLPRSDLDPQKMAEDNSDAVTVCVYPCLRLRLPYSPIY
jgi:hypothetical protein